MFLIQVEGMWVFCVSLCDVIHKFLFIYFFFYLFSLTIFLILSHLKFGIFYTVF